MATWTNVSDDVFANCVAFLEKQRDVSKEDEQHVWTKTLAAASLTCWSWRRGIFRGLRRLAPRCSLQLLPEVVMRFPSLWRLNLTKCKPCPPEAAAWDPVADFPLKSLAAFSELSCLASCPRLIELQIRDINDCALKIIGGLTQLEALHMGRYLTISGTGAQHLRNLRRLSSLEFDGDGTVQSADYEFLSSLSNLRRLQLRNCSIDDKGLRFLEGLVELRVVSLYSCRAIVGSGFSSLGKLDKLESLDVAATNVSEEAFVQLAPCKKLRTLNVSFCPMLMPFGLSRSVCALPLTLLKVIRCDALTLDSVLELKQKMKQCQILFQKAGDVLLEKYYRL